MGEGGGCCVNPKEKRSLLNMDLTCLGQSGNIGGMNDQFTPMVVRQSVRDMVVRFRTEIMSLTCSTKSIGLGACLMLMRKVMDRYKNGEPYPDKMWFTIEIDRMPVRGRPRKKKRPGSGWGPNNVSFEEFQRGTSAGKEDGDE